MKGFDEVRQRLGHMRTPNAGAVGLALVDALEVATKHIIDAIERAQAPIPSAEAVVYPDSVPYIEGRSCDLTHPAERPCLSCASDASIGLDVLTEWPKVALPGRWKWSTKVFEDGERWAPEGAFEGADDTPHGMPRFIVAGGPMDGCRYTAGINFVPGETFTRVK